MPQQRRKLSFSVCAPKGCSQLGKCIIPLGSAANPSRGLLGAWEAVTHSQGVAAAAPECPQVNGILVPLCTCNGEDISKSKDLFTLSGLAGAIWDCKE